jgi:hypothetical protein
MRRRGVRFLNPCREGDYDHQIFEKAATGELIGTTPAAKYHIRILDLNAPHLIQRRLERTAWNAILKDALVVARNSRQDRQILLHLQKIRESARLAIPVIAPPPTDVRG